MKKKKRLADLMEEDLMETTQKRIDELNAELKMLDEQCKFLFPPYDAIAYDAVDSRLRCKRDLRELEDEQRRLRREQERRGREEQERRGREEQERREREDLLQRAKDRDGFLRNTWLGGKWNTPYGIYVFIATEIDSGFYGQNDKTPFLCFIKSSEEDENRLQFEYEHGPAERLTAPGSRAGFTERDARRP